jgi:ferredoxin
MKVKIDESACTGCAVCSDACPEVFALGDDNIAKVIADEVPAGKEDTVRECAANCPVTCISIEE